MVHLGRKNQTKKITSKGGTRPKSSPWKEEGDGNYEDGGGRRVERDAGDDNNDGDDNDDMTIMMMTMMMLTMMMMTMMMKNEE